MISLVQLLRQTLSEGGNVFGNTAPIKKENIDPTINALVKALSSLFPKKATSFKTLEKLGSAGKKDESGDIDLAYSAKFLADGDKPDFAGWNIKPEEYQAQFDSFKKRARTATDAQLNLKTLLFFIAKQIEESNTGINSNSKNVGSGAIFLSFPQYTPSGEELDSRAQIDINIGDPEWLKFSYYSNVYKGAVKGLHRTQLMLALFTHKGKMFKHELGVLDKETREVEAKTPKEALELLNKLYNFDPELTQDTLNDYFELSLFLKEQLSPEEYKELMKRYLGILDKTGPSADIPEDLQQYWIDHQDEFGLTGKFLPQSSNLIKYKK
jgi:hypothetical protein